jgi:streptomycin 6-kinase
VTDLDDLVVQWELLPDGPAIVTESSYLLPVHTDDTPAVLKIGTSEHAHLVLRRWNGHGAVRLLRADPHRRALLLERLSAKSLLVNDDAYPVIADLCRRLHISAMPQLPSAATLVEQWADAFNKLSRSAQIPYRLVEQAAALCRNLATEPAGTVLHGNLHYDTHVQPRKRPSAPSPMSNNTHMRPTARSGERQALSPPHFPLRRQTVLSDKKPRRHSLSAHGDVGGVPYVGPSRSMH